jgi:hypothetical protein
MPDKILALVNNLVGKTAGKEAQNAFEEFFDKMDPLLQVSMTVIGKGVSIAVSLLQNDYLGVINSALDIALLALGVSPPLTEGQIMSKKLDDIKVKIDMIDDKLNKLQTHLSKIHVDVKLNYFLNQINPTIAKIGSLSN